MIEKYIAELLETNNRVIVPDFGAFMVKMDAGKRAVTFNDFLKYNDGLLVNHMASKEKISKDDAFKKIREFVKDLQQTLKTTQKYSIASLGTLVKDERGGVRFLAGEDAPATEVAVKTEAPAEVPAPDVAKPEAPKPEAEAPKTDAKVEDKSQPKPAAGVTPPPPPSGQKPGQPIPQAKPTVKPGTPPPPPGKGPVTVAKKADQKSNMATILIVVGVVVVLGVLGGLLYLNYEDWFGKAEKERLAAEAKREQMRMDSIAQVERMRQDSIRFAEEEAARQAQILKNQKKYYLVAGSFKVEKNAHRFAEQLKSQGYNSEVFMESRGFWRVSYSSFVERKEAFSEYQKLKQKEIQVWVIRH
jgi:nucleoid DNA-binding protein